MSKCVELKTLILFEMYTHLGTVNKLKHFCACGKQMDLSFSGEFIMAALHSRCGHYIFALWFLLYGRPM